ncbi:MAG: hypothetical protein JST86_11205 [Bacteroidetes bacterium]|nr:hypothetical protein [Bacteroidota bacterium]
MEWMLFIVYLVLLSWCITRVGFVKNAGLSPKVVIILFLIKIIAGLAIGWLSLHVYGSGNDYWDVNRDGWSEYQLLWKDPHEYMVNLFRSEYPKGYGGLFDSFQSFWNDLRNNIIIKMISLFDFFSRGNYYVNSLFFNFIGFLGHIAFYRIFIQIYPKQKTAVIVGCFLLPSTMYFVSGVQKDGIVFTTLGLMLYAVFQSLKKKRFSPKRLLIIFTGCVILFLIRSYVLINLLPALMLWIIIATYQLPAWRTFIAGYLVYFTLFFGISSIIPAVNPPETVTNKQAAFFTLPKAATGIALDTLYPNIKSFVRNAPQALNHLLLRPYPGELSVKSMLPINIEWIIYILLVLAFFFFRRPLVQNEHDPFNLFGMFFTFTMFLFIGYIMPNLGSIVRYRSVYLIFLLTPVLCRINWQKLRRKIQIKK